MIIGMLLPTTRTRQRVRAFCYFSSIMRLSLIVPFDSFIQRLDALIVPLHRAYVNAPAPADPSNERILDFLSHQKRILRPYVPTESITEPTVDSAEAGECSL